MDSLLVQKIVDFAAAVAKVVDAAVGRIDVRHRKEK
jgi:hypothetical protein